MEPDAQRPPSSGEVLRGTEALLRRLDGFPGETVGPGCQKEADKAPVSLQRNQRRLDYLLGAE